MVKLIESLLRKYILICQFYRFVSRISATEEFNFETFRSAINHCLPPDMSMRLLHHLSFGPSTKQKLRVNMLITSHRMLVCVIEHGRRCFLNLLMHFIKFDRLSNLRLPLRLLPLPIFQIFELFQVVEGLIDHLDGTGRFISALVLHCRTNLNLVDKLLL